MRGGWLRSVVFSFLRTLSRATILIWEPRLPQRYPVCPSCWRRRNRAMWNLSPSWRRPASQPAGRAPPSLLPGPIVNMADRAGLTARLNTALAIHIRAIPQRGWRVGKACTAHATLLRRRLGSLTFLSCTSGRLCISNNARAGRLIPGRPSRNVNFPLAHFLVAHLQYPEKGLASDFPPVCRWWGKLAPAHLYQKREMSSTADFLEWRDGMPGRNHKMLGRAKRAANADLRILRWGETVGGSSSACVKPHVPVTAAAMGARPASPRFSIWKEHGGMARKVRAVDDM